MHHANATVWALVTTFTLMAWVFQLLRWSRVAQGEGFQPFAILSFYRQWAFPASASATAVTTSSGMPSRFLEAPFRAASRIYERSTGHEHPYESSQRRFTKKPISLTLVVGLIMATAVIGRTPVVIYLLSVAYALIFPWGFPLRRRPRPFLSDHVALGATALSVTFSLLLGFVTWGISPLVAAAVIVLTVPVTLSLAAACVRPAVTVPPSNEPRVRMSRSSRGAVVVSDFRTLTDERALETLDGFVQGELEGRRIVVTGGLTGRGKSQALANYRLGVAIGERECELVVVARTNAEALTAGCGVKTRRFDSRHLAMKWVQRTLVAGDGVLFLGDIPDYYP